MKIKTYITLCFSILIFEASFAFAAMDDARLKERLTDGALLRLLTEEHFWSGITGELDKHSHSELKEVTDEQFHRVLMEIYNESERKMQTLTPNTVEWGQNKDMAVGVLVCLPMCGDVPVKDFLLDYAITKNNDNFTRTIALSSYLRVADAEEARDVLLRFLVGDERMGDYARSSLYVFAKDVWDASSPDKKAAILQALFEAVSSESPPWLFEECDSRLLLMDPAWRDSPRRKSMLERQLSLQFSEHYKDLKNKMEKEFRRISLTTRDSTVSTNTAVPSEQAEILPQPVPLTNGAATTVRERVNTDEAATGEAAGRSLGKLALFGLPGILLLGFGAWRFMRK